MKKKIKIIIAGCVLILLILLMIPLFLPLAEEISSKNSEKSCTGSGCHRIGGSSTTEIWDVDCWGYYWLNICFSDPIRYCEYAQPLEPKEKCVCEAPSDHFRGKEYRKFCEKNMLCYTNSWEYDLECLEDQNTVCKDYEQKLRTEKSCPYCNDSWYERYRTLTDSEKNTVSETFRPFCTLFCRKCDSDICGKNNLCEKKG
jgi:hypothetical protein